MIPPYMQPYVPLADANADSQFDRWCLLAIGDRETTWGTARALDVQGPSGTGDFGPRNPSRWGSALPPDGRGWGRGLLQIDFGGHQAWCLQKAPDGRYLWEIPEENVKQAAGILHACACSLGAVAGKWILPASICAYNAGPGNAFKAFGKLVGSNPSDSDVLKALDACTTGGDYVSWVLSRRDALADSCLPR